MKKEMGQTFRAYEQVGEGFFYIGSYWGVSAWHVIDSIANKTGIDRKYISVKPIK